MKFNNSQFLDFIGAISLGSGLFNSMSLEAGVTHIMCNGSENTLRECELMGISDDYPCEHHAGVLCRGKQSVGHLRQHYVYPNTYIALFSPWLY